MGHLTSPLFSPVFRPSVGFCNWLHCHDLFHAPFLKSGAAHRTAPHGITLLAGDYFLSATFTGTEPVGPALSSRAKRASIDLSLAACAASCSSFMAAFSSCKRTFSVESSFGWHLKGGQSSRASIHSVYSPWRNTGSLAAKQTLGVATVRLAAVLDSAVGAKERWMVGEDMICPGRETFPLALHSIRSLRVRRRVLLPGVLIKAVSRCFSRHAI